MLSAGESRLPGHDSVVKTRKDGSVTHPFIISIGEGGIRGRFGSTEVRGTHSGQRMLEKCAFVGQMCLRSSVLDTKWEALQKVNI